MNKLPRIIHALLCAIALLMLGFAGIVHSSETLDIAQPGDAPIVLAGYFDVLEDPLGNLTLADVISPEAADRFSPAKTSNQALNFGITPSTYWLRLSLLNPDTQPVERILEIAYARLLTVDLYQIAAGHLQQEVQSGYGRPFANRAYKHRFFVFPLKLQQAGETTIYLRVQSRTSLEVPAKLWTPHEFQKYERVDYMLQAAYFGMATGMILFNFLLLISLRDRGYLLYILFIAANANVVAATTGIGTEYLWGDYPDWTTISFSASASATGAFLLAFMRHMLGTAKLMPKVDKVVTAFITANAAAFVLQFFSYQLKLELFIMVCSSLLMIGIALYLSIKRHRAAYLFLAAYTVLLAAVIVIPLRLSGLLPINFWTINGVQIGSALEMIVLAFALADRFHVLRAEKERAQQEALNAERRVVETLRASERALEARVEDRTAELSATVERLKHAQSELVEAEKLASLGSLVAGVAHELNTPIGNALTTATALQSNTRDFMQMAASQPLRRSAFENFLNTSLEMEQLVVRSLDRSAQLISSFKQVAVDQSSEQRRHFDLRELIENNVSTLRPSFKRAKWSLNIEPFAEIDCESYPGPLGQIIVNIVQNAHVHAFEGRDSGSLRISARNDGDQAEIAFTDDGIGMTKETLAHVFDPFFTTKLGKGGSGLGMAISRNLATHLGGSLTVQSHLGQGTTFTLRIPRVAP